MTPLDAQIAARERLAAVQPGTVRDIAVAMVDFIRVPALFYEATDFVQSVLMKYGHKTHLHEIRSAVLALYDRAIELTQKELEQ